MKSKEILRKQCLSHKGYELQSIAKSSITLSDIKECGYRQLQRIPRKISAYLFRDKIDRVFKSECFSDPLDNFYLILSTDGTFFHVDY